MGQIKDSFMVHKDGKEIYPIVFSDSFAELSECLKELQIKDRKVCIVTDTVVGRLYAEEVSKVLESCASSVTVFTMPTGEENKTLDTVKNIYEHLILGKYNRKDLLVALGGGVIGDMTGYTAATYLRGIDFVQIPTTLLSQVDSSIGGKTGVDFDGYKNMVGAFHQPKLVYMNLPVLRSLDDKQFSSGMAEIIKHGCIRDREYFEWLKESKEAILKKDLEVLLKMITKSCKIKREVVEKDPHEKGERALLNYGHTVGHAVEKLKNFTQLHGECVAIGMAAAGYLSMKKGYITKEELCEIRSVLIDFGLPVTFAGLSEEEILQATKLDKKMMASGIRFILLERIGHAVMDDTITEQELAEAIDFAGREDYE